MDGIRLLLQVVRDIGGNSGAGFSGEFKKDCIDLSRRVVLLSHFFEEIMEFKGDVKLMNLSWSSELMVALQDAKKLLVVSASFDHKISPDGAAKKILFQFQSVTWKLEQALANIPYDHFDISEEVKEQVRTHLILYMLIFRVPNTIPPCSQTLFSLG
ncbi:hypothetical protein HanPI659440_Chr08g0283541 [Helianthus annuus]|nr:hypothetical protein HanPI659440_Chr08g0283541 [Helianthus annuus]